MKVLSVFLYLILLYNKMMIPADPPIKKDDSNEPIIKFVPFMLPMAENNFISPAPKDLVRKNRINNTKGISIPESESMIPSTPKK